MCLAKLATVTVTLQLGLIASGTTPPRHDSPRQRANMSGWLAPSIQHLTFTSPSCLSGFSHPLPVTTAGTRSDTRTPNMGARSYLSKKKPYQFNFNFRHGSTPGLSMSTSKQSDAMRRRCTRGRGGHSQWFSRFSRLFVEFWGIYPVPFHHTLRVRIFAIAGPPCLLHTMTGSIAPFAPWAVLLAVGRFASSGAAQAAQVQQAWLGLACRGRSKRRKGRTVFLQLVITKGTLC